MPLLVCLAISRKVRLQTMNLCWDIVKLMPFVYRSLAQAYGAGGSSPPPHPRLLGRLGQSDRIRLTVGQYWHIIKINRKNSLNIGGEICYIIVENGGKINLKIIINYIVHSQFFSFATSPRPVNNNCGIVGHNGKKSGKSLSAPLFFSFPYAYAEPRINSMKRNFMLDKIIDTRGQ